MNENIAESSAALKLSETWKKRFETLRGLGADSKTMTETMRSSEYRALGFKERYKLTFNIWAFLFGPFYYLSKKMWAKGALLMAASWLLASFLSVIEIAVGITIPSTFYWIPVSAICLQFANFDYFKHVMHGEKVWPGTPSFMAGRAGLLGLPIAALVLMFSVLIFQPASQVQTESQLLSNVSGLWRAKVDGVLVTINLSGDSKSIALDLDEYQATVTSVDLDAHVVAVEISIGNGPKLPWTFRQLFVTDGQFTLEMTTHDGTRDELIYVMDL